MSSPASKQTLDFLSQNAMGTMVELEKSFPAMMSLRTRLTALGADDSYNSDSILALFGRLEDLFVGSHFILHELMSSFLQLLGTTINYEKRYHIQNINLSLCEAYSYFSGSEGDGVWCLLKSMIIPLNNTIINSNITIIDNELKKLGIESCDRQMRNVTAHYGRPVKMYNIIKSITEEDKYCTAVSQYMLIHLQISQISMIVFDIINQFIPNCAETKVMPEIATFNIKAFLEDSVSVNITSNELLANGSSESLMKISHGIDSMYEDHLKFERLKEYAVAQNIQLSESVDIIHQLVLIRMIVGFIRCDLTCAMKAYMSSKSGVERSLHLRKIYLIEVSALSNLYGYNQIKKAESLWGQLMLMDVDCNEEEYASLKENLEEFTSYLDNTRRNLYTHFREDGGLNILKRYEAYNELDQIAEINKSLNLLQLCKKIEHYSMLILERVGKKEQQKYNEQRVGCNKMFEKIKDETIKSNLSEEMKAQVIATFNEMEGKVAEFLDLRK